MGTTPSRARCNNTRDCSSLQASGRDTFAAAAAAAPGTQAFPYCAGRCNASLRHRADRCSAPIRRRAARATSDGCHPSGRIAARGSNARCRGEHASQTLAPRSAARGLQRPRLPAPDPISGSSAHARTHCNSGMASPWHHDDMHMLRSRRRVKSETSSSRAPHVQGVIERITGKYQRYIAQLGAVSLTTPLDLGTLSQQLGLGDPDAGGPGVAGQRSQQSAWHTPAAGRAGTPGAPASTLWRQAASQWQEASLQWNVAAGSPRLHTARSPIQSAPSTSACTPPHAIATSLPRASALAAGDDVGQGAVLAAATYDRVCELATPVLSAAPFGQPVASSSARPVAGEWHDMPVMGTTGVKASPACHTSRQAATQPGSPPALRALAQPGAACGRAAQAEADSLHAGIHEQTWRHEDENTPPNPVFSAGGHAAPFSGDAVPLSSMPLRAGTHKVRSTQCTDDGPLDDHCQDGAGIESPPERTGCAPRVLCCA